MADNSNSSATNAENATYENLPFKKRFNLMLAKSAIDTSPTPSWGAGLARALTGGLAGIYEKQDSEVENKANSDFTGAMMAARSPQLYDPQAMGAALSRPQNSPNAAGKIYSNDEPSPLDPPQGKDRDMMARTIVAEAGNQAQMGQDAVASVVRNRAVNGGFGGNTPGGVVQSPNQFEPWNTAGGRGRMASIDPNGPQYANADKAISSAYGEGGQAPNDPTAGKTMFYAPQAQAALGRAPPSWSNGGGGQPIGDHVFYNSPGSQATPQQPQQGQPQAQPQGMDPRIAAAMNNPNISINHKVALIQASAPSAEYGIIGKDQYGNEQYGWKDNVRRTVTPGPYATSSQQALANGPGQGPAIPSAPPGADPKKWREEYTSEAAKNASKGALPGTSQEASSMRKELQDVPSYKNLSQAAPVYKSMVDAAGRDNRAADVNLIYGIAKVMDPGSVVRESEMTVAQAVATLPQQLRATVESQLMGGGRLSPSVRASIMQEAHSRVQAYSGMYDQDMEHFKGIAERNRLNPDDVIRKFGAFEQWKAPQQANAAQPQQSGMPSLEAIDAELARRSGGAR